MYPDAYDLSSLSLATSNQSVALISINHMSDPIERYLTACTPGESDMSTVPLCLPKPPARRRLPLTPPPPVIKPNPAQCSRLPFAFSPPIRPRSPSTPAIPAIPPTPLAAVARPHAHHVGNPEATRYCTVRCCCALPSHGDERPTAPRGGVGEQSLRQGLSSTAL